MEADEEWTLAQLKAHRRALIDPKIKEHRDADGGIRHGLLHTHRRSGDAGAEGEARAPLVRGGESPEPRWRTDRRQADARPVERRPDRRPESRHPQRLVRRSPSGTEAVYKGLCRASRARPTSRPSSP
jgi:hypothetical protein